MNTTHTVGFVSKLCRESHTGEKGIKIGGKRIYLGASSSITAKAVNQVDFLLPLNGSIPYKMAFGSKVTIINCKLIDFGGVPPEWGAFINEMAEYIRHGKRLLAYCTGSHGRTGCFGASLIAVLEPNIKDPIAEIRNRHCKHAVETRAQAEAVFALRNSKLPAKYEKEFVPRFTVTHQSSAGVSLNMYESWKHFFRKDESVRASGTAQEALDLFNQTPSMQQVEESVIDSIYGLDSKFE